MKHYSLYYATNRGHEGAERWRPKRYGKDFSTDGRENLRFGELQVRGDEAEVAKHLNAQVADLGTGNGEKLASYFAGRARKADIRAYREGLSSRVPDDKQDLKKFGSEKFFSELHDDMLRSTDVLVYIHGYNVSWEAAVGSALALQEMLNRPGVGDKRQRVSVVLFTWPSDGSMFPYRAYKADRADARDSGYAVGRAILKLRDYLSRLREASAKNGVELCQQDIHLACHSMGNYVLENALQRVIEYNRTRVLPRLFEHVFMCSPDVDDTVLEESAPMARLHELANSISVYYNRNDKALIISDVTKSNPTRLGTSGAARPFKLHNKLHQIDCTPVATGLIQHSYYLAGNVNADIRQSIDGIGHDGRTHLRESTGELPNVWRMKKV